MKSAERSDVGSSIRRVTSIFLILTMFATLAATSMAKAADLKTTTSVSQPHSGEAAVDASPRLVAEQAAWFCDTPYGRFPLVVAAPVGYPCVAEFNFPPYVATGIAGY